MCCRWIETSSPTTSCCHFPHISEAHPSVTAIGLRRPNRNPNIMNDQFIEQLQSSPLATVTDYYANPPRRQSKAIDYRWSQLRRKMALVAHFCSVPAPVHSAFASLLFKISDLREVLHGRPIASTTMFEGTFCQSSSKRVGYRNY